MLHSHRAMMARLGLMGALAVAAVGASAQMNRFVYQDLGILPQGTSVVPKKMNNSGIVVGHVPRTTTSSAFLWESGLIYDLGILPGRPASRSNWVNRFSTVIGTSGVGSTARAFVWTNGTMNFLPNGAGIFGTEGVGINDSNTIAYNVDRTGNQVYKDGTVIVGTNVLPVPPIAGAVNMNITAISNLNWVAGTSLMDDGTLSSWNWRIPILPGDTFTPNEINVADAGEIVNVTDMSDNAASSDGSPLTVGMVGPVLTDGFGNPTYFFPRPFAAIGTQAVNPLLLEGDNVGEVYGVNTAFTLVGRSGRFEILNGVGTYHWKTVLWFPILPVAPFWVPFEIDPYMPPNSGITLLNALDINDLGQVVGTYTRAGQLRGIRLSPVVTPVTLALDPESIPGGFSGEATVVLDDTAPFGGASVNITASNSIVSVPSSVTVAGGQTSKTFTYVTSPVGKTTSVVIRAERAGYIASNTLLVQPTALDRLTVTPTLLPAGGRGTGTAFLAGRAPASGFRVFLSSSNTAAAQVPASVLVPAGASQATFTVYGMNVLTNTPATISGTAFSIVRTANITVMTPFLEILTVTPDQVYGGQQAPGWVQLSSAAKAPGAAVNLQSSSPGIGAVPNTVTVLTGTRVASFKVNTVVTRFNINVTITGWFNGQVRTDTVLIRGAALQSLSVNPNPLIGGNNAVGTATLDWFSFTGGSVVTLQSNLPSVLTVPASVTVPAGQTAGNFNVTSAVVTVPTNVTVSGNYLGVNQTTTVVVNP